MSTEDKSEAVDTSKAQEIVERVEGTTRTAPGLIGLFIFGLLVSMSLYHLYYVWASIPTQVFRASHLLFVLPLVFLLYPALKNEKRSFWFYLDFLACASVVAGSLYLLGPIAYNLILHPPSWLPFEALTAQILVGALIGLGVLALFGISRLAKGKLPFYDLILVMAAIASTAYIILDFEKFIYRSVTPNALDMAFGTILILLILEATRRAVGWPLVFIIIAFIAYAFFGRSLPGDWAHRGYDLERLVGHFYMTLEGIFSIPLDVAATFIILFTIYGAVLDQSGAGKFFVDLSLAITKGRRTGAGQAATVASFLLGGPSGSGVATAVTVGTITYPILKRAGYSPAAAGGLLAAGGIGAVISPPILGAAAFLIAEFLKVSYLDVIKMSIIPTILFYFGILLMIELDARRFQLAPVPVSAPNPFKLSLRYWYHFISLFIIVILMFKGATAFNAVVIATFVGVATIYLDLFLSYWKTLPKTQLFTKTLIEGTLKIPRALADGSRQILSVSVTCAAAGIIIGVTTLTGLGLKFADLIVGLAQNQLLATILLSALALWILGMALPITVSYVVAAVIIAPALAKLGVVPVAAHMFIFYYSILSEVSPPVGLSAMAVSAFTGASPYKTMMQAWRYTLPVFLVPVMFVLGPGGVALLLTNSSWWEITGALIAVLLSLTFIVAGVSGWLFGPIHFLTRFFFIPGGLLLAYIGKSQSAEFSLGLCNVFNLGDFVMSFCSTFELAAIGLGICVGSIILEFFFLRRREKSA
jgi:TRAP transporter 4TM/12TM fusion protein